MILLAVPSIFVGAVAVEPMLYGEFFKDVIIILPDRDFAMLAGPHFSGWYGMGMHGFMTIPFFLALGGVFFAWFFCIKKPHLTSCFKHQVRPIYLLLEEKYFIDKFNDWFFVRGAKKFGLGLWKIGDTFLIDNLLVNGSARTVRLFSLLLRKIQSGSIYHYAFSMVFGLILLLGVWFFGGPI